jgi:hypothetical protein
MSLKQWLYQSSVANRRLAPRRPANQLIASYRTPSGIHQASIRDISATGLFLLADEPWQPGTSVAFTLHRFRVASADPQDQSVSMSAHVIRASGDGVACAFDLPSGVEPVLWTHLVEAASCDVALGDVVGLFKMARAFTFLARICSADAVGVRQTLRFQLTGQRLWKGIDIALQAENLVLSDPGEHIVRCDGGIVMRILQEGSWTEEQILSQCWASLLATACRSNSVSDSRKLVDLFAQLTLVHYRILSTASASAAKYLTPSGSVAARPYTAYTTEIMQFSETRDLLRMGRSLEHLADLGLLEERFNTSIFAPVDAIRMTPTPLGLLLHARCNGCAGSLQTFYPMTQTLPIAAAS